MRKKVLVLLSGGIDSAVCVAMLRERGCDLTTLSFRQEARTNNMPEVLSARAIAAKFCTRHIEVDLTSVDNLLVHSRDLRLSLGGQINNCPGTRTRGAPMSVSIMLSMATMHACSAGIEEVAWGLHEDDLPDAMSRQRVERLVSLHIELARLQAPHQKLAISFPLAEHSKREIVEMAQTYGIDIASTFSCSDPENGRACGRCGQCLAREDALSPQERRRIA